MKKHALGVLIGAAAALSAADVAVAGGPAKHHNGAFAAVNDTCGAATTGSVSFVKGPGHAPAGRGSVQFTTGANGDSYPTLRTARYDGVKLSNLTALNYWTYVGQAVGTQAAYIDLYVDNDGNGTRDDILTFEPTYNGSVMKTTWQRWDALTG